MKTQNLLISALLTGMSVITMAQNTFPTTTNSAVGIGTTTPTTSTRLSIVDNSESYPNKPIIDITRSVTNPANTNTSETLFNLAGSKNNFNGTFTTSSSSSTLKYSTNWENALSLNGSISNCGSPSACGGTGWGMTLGMNGIKMTSGTVINTFQLGYIVKSGNILNSKNGLFFDASVDHYLGTKQALRIVTNNVERMSVESDGKVLIGTSTTGALLNKNTTYNYSLYVGKGILTEKIRCSIANSSDWADYVFAPEYKLKSLSEVETYINANKHLPGIPSADDMVENGLDVAQTDALLLEKIEELTLYMIQMQKEIEALKKTNAEFQKLLIKN
jgi:trimeric autotransporter adhesin